MQMYPVMCFPHIFTSRVRSCHSPLDWSSAQTRQYYVSWRCRFASRIKENIVDEVFGQNYSWLEFVRQRLLLWRAFVSLFKIDIKSCSMVFKKLYHQYLSQSLICFWEFHLPTHSLILNNNNTITHSLLVDFIKFWTICKVGHWCFRTHQQRCLFGFNLFTMYGTSMEKNSSVNLVRNLN